MSEHVKPSILEEAGAIVYGDREDTYGDPGKNLRAIAGMWSAYLTTRQGRGIHMEPHDVAAMMILLKTARLANSPKHRDSLVDICGYAALTERLND